MAPTELASGAQQLAVPVVGINSRPYLVTRRRVDRSVSFALCVLPRGLFLSREFPRLADRKLMPHSFLEGEKLCSPVIHTNPVIPIHSKKELPDDKR